MKTTALWLLAIGFFSSAPAQAKSSVCDNPRNCVSEQECIDTLKNEFKWGLEIIKPFCRMDTGYREWDIIRKKEVFPNLVASVKRYASVLRIFNLSSFQLLAFTYYYLPVAKANATVDCAVDFFTQIGVRAVRSHDSCEAIYRFHPVQKRTDLFNCALKQRRLDTPPEEAMSLCIKYIFYK